MNKEIEDLLKKALERRRAPLGFASRVTARLPVERGRPWRPLAAMGLAASLLVGIGVGGVRYREYREGQEAKAKLMLALEITAEKLEMARRKVNQGRID